MKALLLLLFMFTYYAVWCQLPAKDDRKIDSLKKVIASAKSDTTRLKAYKSWDDLIYLSDPELDRELNTQSVDLAEKNLKRKGLTRREIQVYKISLANSLNNLSYYYKDKAHVTKAKAFAKRALKISTSINDTLRIKSALNALGIICIEQGDYKNGIDYYNHCLLICEKKGDPGGIVSTLNNIGTAHYNMGDYDKALSFYRQSLKKTPKQHMESQNYGNVLGNIGNVYLQYKEYDSVMVYFNKSLAVKRKIGDRQGEAFSLSNIGISLIGLGKLDEALRMHEQALAINQEIDFKRGVANELSYISEIYHEKGEYKKALGYSLPAYAMAKREHFLQETASSSFSLYKTYKALGKYREAMEMYEISIGMRDSLESAQNRKAVIAQGFQYDYLKQQARAEKEKAVAAEKEFRQQIITWGVVAGLGLVLVFSLIVVKRLRIAREQKSIIEEQKRLVEHKQKEIIDSIKYASRIQKALLPGHSYIKKELGKDRQKKN
ncbi:MAG TPA: tetratricopeptide repeat protein [Flavobacteriales bacterium]|nr:tetratricopeptide repeat protein [Flavobacteriales bacterium]